MGERDHGSRKLLTLQEMMTDYAWFNTVELKLWNDVILVLPQADGRRQAAGHRIPYK